MKVTELLTEGMWVIKNIDGKEKRFKDRYSQAAKDWAASRSPKKASQAPKYSQEWWEDRDDYERVVPWTRITEDDIDLSNKGLQSVIKDHTGSSAINDYSIQGRGTKVVDGVRCATVELRVVYEYNKADLGIDPEDTEDPEEEHGLEGVWLRVRRDVQNPKKIVFDGYTN